MKYIFVLIIGVMLLAGCSGHFLEHDTIYKTNQHMYYSLFGYDNPDSDVPTIQDEQGGWWGDEYDMNGNLVKEW